MTLDELSLNVEEYLNSTSRIVTLIGSGASYGAVPLMGKTFKEYSYKKCFDQDFIRLLKNFHEMKSLKESVDRPSFSIVDEDGYFKSLVSKTNVEEFLSWLKYRIEGGLVQSGEQEIHQSLYDYFVNSVWNSSGVDRNKISESKTNGYSEVLGHYQRFIQGLGESRKIIASRARGDCDVISLFTTNYDLLHEDALEKSGYLYTDGFSQGLSHTFDVQEFHRRPIDMDNRFRDRLELISPYFRLYKLHGSINWIKNEETNLERRSVGAIDRDSVLIAPETTKYALTQNSPFSAIFREFANTLAIPNTILIVAGFSFGDEHISDIIQQALMKSDFTLIAFVPGYKSEKLIKNSKIAPILFKRRAEGANAIFISPVVDSEGQEGVLNRGSTLEDTSSDEYKENPMLFSDVAAIFEYGAEYLSKGRSGDGFMR